MIFNMIRHKGCAFFAWLGVAGLFGHPAFAGEVHPVPETYDEVEVETVTGGPRLLFSDSPESVYEKGILFRGVADGDTRLFLHHLNETKETLKIAVLLRPVSEGTFITWGLRGIGAPNRNYFEAARESQRHYFEGYVKNRSFMVRPDYKTYRHERHSAGNQYAPDYYNIYANRSLAVTHLNPGEFVEGLSLAKNSRFLGTRVRPQELLTGMFDFRTRGPVEVLVLIMGPKDDAVAFAGAAKELPMDEHPLRGIYEHGDLTYFVKKPVQVLPGQTAGLTMGVSDDPLFLKGKDPMSGTETVDYGNYGVIYHVVYDLDPSAGDEPLSLSYNPWGGNFAGTGLIAGREEKIVGIPPAREVFGEQDKRETILKLTPSQDGIRQEFLWSPPGASNLPLRIFWTKDVPERNVPVKSSRDGEEPGRMRAAFERFKAERDGVPM